MSFFIGNVTSKRRSALSGINMPDNNTHIAGIFDEIADMLDVQGANFFRVRAYYQAARQLRSMSEDIAQYGNKAQDISKLPAIGHNLVAKIIEILETGNCVTLATT